MKKLLALILSLIMVLALVACGSGGEEDPADDGEGETAEAVKVALLASSPMNDGGWNEDAYNALLQMEEDGAEIAYTENVAAADIQSLLRNYADNGFNLIIGNGFEYSAPMAEVAPEYPDVYFFANSGDQSNGTNLGGCLYTWGEMGYLTGYLAGKMTETNKIGFVGAMETLSISAEVRAFTDAAKLVNPDAEVTVAYTGSWSDVTKGYEAAQAQINAGCDVLMGIGDACDAGAIQACGESGGKAVFIGFASDMNFHDPEVVVTSGVQSTTRVMKWVYDEMVAGNFPAVTLDAGAKDGFQYLGTWCDWIDPELKQELLDEEQKVIAGDYVKSDFSDLA